MRAQNRMYRQLSLIAGALLCACLFMSTLQAETLGQKIAQQGNGRGAPSCSGCHGADGAGIGAAGFPRLAGQDAAYLTRQLQAFRDGSRKNAVMMPIAKALDAKEGAAVAQYYAGLKAASTAQPDPNAPLALGAGLAVWGSWADRHLPACQQCHGAKGQGIGSTFPALAGQQVSYIKNQLNDWRSGKRTGDVNNLMRDVAKKLKDNEIDAVASYYASLPVGTHAAQNSAAIVPIDPAAVADGGKASTYFTPPAHGAYPEGPFGEAVRNGEAIYKLTNSHPDSQRYVGNKQQCANCHLDAGRLYDSAPMWGGYTAYPVYRKKNKKVNDIVMRVQGCYTYSMNAQGSVAGKAPAGDDKAIIDLISYMYWMSTGIPTGKSDLAGRSYPKFKQTKEGFDPVRGKKVFEAQCAVCHGADGQGVSQDGVTVFPPLWGNSAYNWGAGMHQVNKAAFFIKANMPLGQPDTLSEQQAWDVSAYINSHERPQDPRHKGDFKATAEKYHAKHLDYYGKRKGENGKLLGEAATKK